MRAGWRAALSAIGLGVTMTWAACAHAALLTPEEAQQPGNRVCKPAKGGMLDCTDLAEPDPAPSNDASIQPLPAIKYSGEHFPAPTAEAPIKPALDTIPEKLDSDSVRIGWDINFGTTAQYWEIYDNGVLAMRSQEFTQRTLVSSSKQDISARAVSVQSGEYTLRRLAAGRHLFEVRLCNANVDGSPLCTSVTGNTWVGDVDQTLGSPSTPEIEWLPSVSTGEPVELTWHMWWGVPGHYWQVLDQGRVVYESTTFNENTDHTQSASTQLRDLAAGTHALTVRLCSKLDCADSEAYPLEVMLAGVDAAALPKLALLGKVADSWVVMWSVPMLAAAKQPLRWRWIDADSGQAIGADQTKARECESGADELVQKTSQTRSYCGQTRLLAAQAPVRLGVEVCWATERACRRSEPLELVGAARAGR
ncbi:chitinase N-terminal domain-containing protein [Amantichitinum ursilacus]|uniref:Chitinase A N-terminal domain-containing protein n=1 Tax=Amantichitinum ursilacus TaxID=857265 RepID=A0A0N0XN42_9NEIS|nr:chitinase N-terminal domain-containing protein [Amantichitinum ursilacus]KPC55337.1 hypothetical protein WG78_01730 [Amantichitinum ursilacus]